ncbi:probable ATP-dependent RNA helicase kurz [Malaya genurostris]|uniref:probable ATP-dependent RNA helicase kurz n=1 Tax=Malaya genurostris TaxID=325434 RepID=UPI0026F3C273|nr:probable ATP-dependent RNA helicase kurz [Malaya genurostris]
MGKRRYNEKGRKHNETIIDNSATKQIKLEFGCQDYGGEDESNLLVLPSKKRPTKIKRDKGVVNKILSKKQRKHLERIVDQKKKKENRSSLITSLSQVQLTNKELQNYTKLSSVQTKGLRQHLKEQSIGITVKTATIDSSSCEQKSRNMFGKKKKRPNLLRDKEVTLDKYVEQSSKNLNLIDFDESLSSDDEKVKGMVEHSVPDQQNTSSENLSKVTGADSVEASSITDAEKKTKIHYEHVERKTATYVHISRKPEIQAARLKLPILAEEQVIMETISENSVIILAGETGSGKTTQIPQFLYEAGYALPERGMIVITEPRRVAAISMSKRISTEMNVSNDIVSYLIRFEGNVTDHTRIKFVTDGVLLKEIEQDFLLSSYSVVILDEAHERSIYTDILVGLLSRIVMLRNKKGNPLKLIIMSATLRVKDFTENKMLFNKIPPIINIESRQFPVTVHFSKSTASDYIREAFSKAVKIHTKLPDGGILIFLTGQKEVTYVVKKLQNAFPCKRNRLDRSAERTSRESASVSEDEDENLKAFVKQNKGNKLKLKNYTSRIHLPKINLDNYQMPWDDTEADQQDDVDNDDMFAVDISDSESDCNEQFDISEPITDQPLWVLPLYSVLPTVKQQQVFKPPPVGTRLCVVATNIAETSLTIPGIRYVIDSGRQKTKLYDKVTGVTAFVVTFISKASANQRAGRAGRVTAGHCYRLYSSALYNNEFVDFATPEIQIKPVDDLMLQMKCMGIDKVVNFPYPSPPDRTQLEIAEKRLLLMDALQECIVNRGKKSQTVSRITNLGRTIAAFPVAPRFGKMLALSHQYGLLPYTICMIAALSVQEVLQEVSFSDESSSCTKWRSKRKSWAGSNNSLLLGDPMILLRVVGAAEFANSKNQLEQFCTDNGIRLKAIKEIRKLRVQLTNESNANLMDLNLTVDPMLLPPNDTQAKLLRQLMLIGMADRVAHKIPDSELKLNVDRIKYKYAYYLPDIEEPVFIHSSSVLQKQNLEWICYQEAYEITEEGKTKIYLRGITAIEPEWLLQLVPKHCNIIKILDEPEPTYDSERDSILCFVQATIGKSGWVLPITEIEMPYDMTRCQYFLKFFLSGQIFPKLKRFKKVLLSSPEAVLKAYSSSVPRINALVQTVLQNEIFDRKCLTQVWEINRNFLLHEYQQFLPVSCHHDVRNIWPPI